MFIELKFLCARDGFATVSMPALLGLTESLSLPVAQESVAGTVQLFADAEALCDSLSLVSRTKARRRVYIIVSPELVEPGTAQPTALAKRLLQISWEQDVILGLIGLVPKLTGPVPSVDEVVSLAALDIAALRAKVQSVATRLWFKLPPVARADSARPQPSYVVRQIVSAAHLQQSLALRHRIYQALGYLDERVVAAQQQIELDSYDPAAIHFMVSERDAAAKLVASMRIIMPGWQRLPRTAAFLQACDYGAWCEAFANEEVSPVFRRMLNKPPNNALPLLACFNYFHSLTAQPLFRDMILPQNSCELSRVVVHPDSRGQGILKLLMEHAIAVAKRMGRRFLLLECAPFHAEMYAKFGFVIIEDEGRRYYSRAQRLDTWAVAMYLDLDSVAVAAAPPLPALADHALELAVADPRQLGLRLRIASLHLDRAEIERRLQTPYLLPRRAQKRREYVLKGGKPSLALLVQNSFADLDGYLAVLLSEVFQRVPDAQVTLVDADGRELTIDEAQCISTMGAPSLHDVIHRWLEEHHVAA